MNSIELATAKLTGNFVPERATILPAQYARFSTFPVSLRRELGGIRDKVRYEQAYEVVWTGLCMFFDEASQKELIGLLRQRLPIIHPGEHSLEIQKYWENLAQQSIYPFYREKKDELNQSGYTVTAVNRWDIAGYFKNRVSPALYIGNKELRKGAVGDWMTGEGRVHLFYEFHDQVLAEGGEDLLKYVQSLELLNAARRISIGKVLTVIDQLRAARQGKMIFVIPDKKVKIENLLKATEPYHLLARWLFPEIKDREEKLFADKALSAGNLWRCAVHLRFGALPENIRRAPVRKSLVELLLTQQYDQAGFYVEELMAKYPGILPAFVESDLKINPSLLRDLMKEEAMSETEATINHREEEKRRRVDEKKTARVLVQKIVGRQLVSADGRYTMQVKEVASDPPFFLVISPQWQEILGRKHGIGASAETIIELIGNFGFGISE